MDTAQVAIAPAAAGLDTLIHEQLLDRRRRLRDAHAHHGPNEDFTRLLDEVDAALLKYENGTYGVCIDCRGEVEPERLINDPLMSVCLGCLTEKQRASLEDDLQLAADIQRGLLPRSGKACDHWHVEYAYHPAGIVSGDYVDIIERGSEFIFILGDVSGKGLAASILMSNLHAMFHSLVPMKLPLNKLMARANRLLCESSLANQYATLIAGKASRSGEIEIANAGHLPPILIKNGVKGELEQAGLPLGMFCEAEFEVDRFHLSGGDSLFLFTDGVTEAVDAAGSEFGTSRLFEAINGGASASPGELIGRCLGTVDAFRGNAERHDDLTMLTVTYL